MKSLAPILLFLFFTTHEHDSCEAHDSALLLNNSKAEGELRCTHAEERCSAASQISDFRQEEDYVLLHQRRATRDRICRRCTGY